MFGCRRSVSVVGIHSILLIEVPEVRATWWWAQADSVLRHWWEFLVHSIFSVSEDPFEFDMFVTFMTSPSGTLMLTPPRPRIPVLCMSTPLTTSSPSFPGSPVLDEPDEVWVLAGCGSLARDNDKLPHRDLKEMFLVRPGVVGRFGLVPASARRNPWVVAPSGWRRLQMR